LIITENLTKDYGRHRAVDHVDIHVKAGEIYGFLGPNGAGKTTTIRMLIGLLLPTEGRIVLAGHDLEKEPVAAKSVVGFIPDRPFLYEKLTGEEFLRFMAGLYGIAPKDTEERIPELLRFFDLSDWGNELIESFSHGMKQRLVMAAAMIHKPRIIIVDEPMVGLDPRGARLLKEVFRRMAKDDGCSIFMSTHTLEVAEQMCDRIAIINGGRIIAEGTMEELRSQAQHQEGDLEEIFLRLTGGEDMRDIIESLRV
jgi:ABC-2 type transport system ATP-binding protein